MKEKDYFKWYTDVAVSGFKDGAKVVWEMYLSAKRHFSEYKHPLHRSLEYRFGLMCERLK